MSELLTRISGKLPDISSSYDSYAVGYFKWKIVWRVILCAGSVWLMRWNGGGFDFAVNYFFVDRFDKEYQKLLERELVANVNTMMRAWLLLDRLIKDVTIYIGRIGILL